MVGSYFWRVRIFGYTLRNYKRGDALLLPLTFVLQYFRLILFCQVAKHRFKYLNVRDEEEPMKEKAVLIITHGNFSRELLKSAELIMGEQKDVVTLGLNLGDDIESLRMDVEKIVVENQKANKETIILVDLFGGSTSNSALSVSKNYDVKILTGVNLPMLIEILSSRDKYDTEELIEIVYKSSVDGIKKLGSKL